MHGDISKNVFPTPPVPSAFAAPTCRNGGLYGESNSPKHLGSPGRGIYSDVGSGLSSDADAYPETTESQPDNTENRARDVFPNLYINPIPWISPLMNLAAGPVLVNIPCLNPL